MWSLSSFGSGISLMIVVVLTEAVIFSILALVLASYLASLLPLGLDVESRLFFFENLPLYLSRLLALAAFFSSWTLLNLE